MPRKTTSRFCSCLEQAEEKKCYPIPYSTRINFHVGKSLIIKGSTVAESQRFTFDFYHNSTNFNGSDLPFHFSVRLDDKAIVLNTFKNGKWEQEKRKENPIQKGDNFEICIQAEMDRFLVFIDGKEFQNYEYRIDLEKITHLAIGGDIYLNHVEWEKGENKENLASGYTKTARKELVKRTIAEIYDTYCADEMCTLVKSQGEIMQECERLLLNKRKLTNRLQHRPKSNVICHLMVDTEAAPKPRTLKIQANRLALESGQIENSQESTPTFSTPRYDPPTEFLYKATKNSYDTLYECLRVFLKLYIQAIKKDCENLDDLSIITYYTKIWPIFLIASVEIKSNTFSNPTWRKNRRNYGVRGVDVVEVKDGLPNTLGLSLHYWRNEFFKEISTHSLPFTIRNLIVQELYGVKNRTSIITPEIIHSYKLLGLIKSSVPIVQPPTPLEKYEFIRWHFDVFPKIPRNKLLKKMVAEAKLIITEEPGNFLLQDNNVLLNLDETFLLKLPIKEHQCDEKSNLLIGVYSCPSEISDREEIRQTWGHPNFRRSTTKLIFIIGKDKNPNANFLVAEEHKNYGDILLIDLNEHYRNLSLKTFGLLFYANKFCQNINAILKSDIDFVLNIKAIEDLCEKLIAQEPIITGKVKRGAPRRNLDAKWYLPHFVYPKKTFPDYVYGGAYLLSGCSILKKILQTLKAKTKFFFSENYRRLPEDLIFTGEIREVLNIPLMDIGKGISIIKCDETLGFWCDSFTNFKKIPLACEKGMDSKNVKELWNLFQELNLMDYNNTLLT